MTTRWRAPIFMMFAIVSLGSMLIAIGLWIHRSGRGEILDPRYQRFMQCLADDRKTEALELGNPLFNALLLESPDDPAIALLSKRLNVAGQIQALISDRVQPSQTAIMEGIAGMDGLGLPPPVVQGRDTADRLLPPAREVYWTHLETFTIQPVRERLSSQQMMFCERYYDLRMQDSILQIGRRIIVTSPDSSESACQAMVLPLLYSHGRDEVWDQMGPFLTLFSPEMLDVLSMFALLQVERPGVMMAIARYKAKATGKEFSLTRWASDVTDICVANHRPDLVETLLSMTLTTVTDSDTVAELRLKIAEGYARCGDYPAAAHVSEKILADLPGASLYGRIVAVHLGYLAKEDNVEQVTAMTASILDDPRCRPHLAQILYLRWWALCKTSQLEEAAKVAERLLGEYSDSPCAAPVLLERATEALAHQEYGRCRELLVRLTGDFAGTESAKRAQDILARLRDSALE